MTAAAIEASQAETPQKQNKVNWSRWATITCVAGSVTSAIAAAIAALEPQLRAYVAGPYLEAAEYVLFALAITTSVFCSWRRAIADVQLPLKNGDEPRYEHVSGWSAILLGCVMIAIAGLAWWAAQSDDANRKIHAEFGTAVVIGVSFTFILVAAAPTLLRWYRNSQPHRDEEEEDAIEDEKKSSPIEALGAWLSAIDGLLVFAIANAVGTNRPNFFVRYGVLLATIGSCAALGYFWDAPWSFFPIAWGFVIAFSVSRRWAWIEQDRELAMLNPTLSQRYIRVGFDQDLRDEALVVFLSMFLLVPLALRQAQLFATAHGVEMFQLGAHSDVHDLGIWIAFYGTELAKAVPFVDWAEVYHVEGDAPVTATSAAALHAVFATRVLIDLVFLAALLQAISSASRDAQQRELFYKKHAIPRLDPFTEPDAFRALVRKGPNGWEKNESLFDRFPKYDLNRLTELTAHKDERVRRAAEFLVDRDNSDATKDPNYRLSKLAADKTISDLDVRAAIDEIVQAGSKRNAYQLGVARVRLLSRQNMTPLRREIVRLITQALHGDRDRRDALIASLVGEHRELTYQSRTIALEALAEDAGRDLTVRHAIEQAASSDAAQTLRNKARQILEAHPEIA
ncbi:MAG: hypothetical protein ABUS48_05570 [Pseudomonadota bacterium]